MLEEPIEADPEIATTKIESQSPAVMCPKCRNVFLQGECLGISLGGDSDGQYCLSCYARWVAATLPKLVPASQVLRP